MATEIYQHNPSGEKFAIRRNGVGNVIDASGPLYYKDIPAFLSDDWDGDPELTAEFQEMDLIESGYFNITTNAANECTS